MPISRLSLGYGCNITSKPWWYWQYPLCSLDHSGCLVGLHPLGHALDFSGIFCCTPCERRNTDSLSFSTNFTRAASSRRFEEAQLWHSWTLSVSLTIAKLSGVVDVVVGTIGVTEVWGWGCLALRRLSMREVGGKGGTTFFNVLKRRC